MVQCRDSGHSLAATRGCTAASTGKRAAGEWQLLMQEHLYCFWKQAGKSAAPRPTIVSFEYDLGKLALDVNCQAIFTVVN